MENVQDLDIAWLAGIIDGEGNIHFGSKKASANEKRYIDIKVRVSNTDMRMVKKISEIYHAMNLRFHFAIANLKNKNLKTAISVNVTAQGSNRKLLKAIIPYLVSKKKIAQIVLDMLNFVESFPKGGGTKRYNYWNSRAMADLVKEYQEEKAWYFDPSTTTRRANTIFVFGDIV